MKNIIIKSSLSIVTTIITIFLIYIATTTGFNKGIEFMDKLIYEEKSVDAS